MTAPPVIDSTHAWYELLCARISEFVPRGLLLGAATVPQPLSAVVGGKVWATAAPVDCTTPYITVLNLGREPDANTQGQYATFKLAVEIVHRGRNPTNIKLLHDIGDQVEVALTHYRTPNNVMSITGMALRAEMPRSALAADVEVMRERLLFDGFMVARYVATEVGL